MNRDRSFFHDTILLFAIVLLFSACNSAEQVAPTPDAQDQSDFVLVVSATGEVVPSEWSTLSISANGVAESILVKEGERVQKNQALVRLSGNDQLQANVTAAEAALETARQNIQSLYDNLELDRAAAKKRLAEANKALDKATKRRAGKDYRVGSAAQIDIAWANLVIAREAVKNAEETYAIFEDRAEDDPDRAAVLSQLGALRQQRDLTEAQFNYLLKLPDELEVADADAELALAQSEVEAAQKNLDKLKDGPDTEKLTVAQANLKNAEEQLKASHSALNNLELKAPFNGTISKLYIHPQEWVQAGSPVIQLANLEDLRIETTDLSEIDVARIDIGSPVTITFDALPDVSTSGVVTNIAPKSSEGSGVNYTVVISLNSIPDRLRWGMTAFTDIQVNE